MATKTSPNLYLEKNFEGQYVLRVEEAKFVPVFEADKTIANKASSLQHIAYQVKGDFTTDVKFENIDFKDTRLGISVERTGKTAIYDITYDDIKSSDIYGGVFKIGHSMKSNYTGTTFETKDITYIQRVVADGKEAAPLVKYSDSNRDFLTSEKKNAPVFLRDITAKNFSDGIIDVKSSVYIMNATLENAHRILRAWGNVEIILVNCQLSNTGAYAKEALAWVLDSTSSIKFYNTTWNGLDAPTADMVRMEGKSAAAALKQFVQLDHNPLEAMDPFFASNVDDVHIQVSSNGRTWKEFIGDTALLGDPQYLVAELGGGIHNFRSYFILEDGTKSDFSNTVSYFSDAPVWKEDITVTGTNGANRLLGDTGDDTLIGLAGNDELVGGAGADKLDGGAGVDAASYDTSLTGLTINVADMSKSTGDAKGDTLISIETIRATNFNDIIIDDNAGRTLTGYAGDDKIYGNGGNDSLYAGEGNDYLNGGTGNDLLRGGAGNDILIGGLGKDLLYGDEGADVFKFLHGDLDGNKDSIYGFSVKQGDQIDISDLLDSVDMVGHAIQDFVFAAIKDGDTVLSFKGAGDNVPTAFATIEGVQNLGSVADMVQHGVLVV